LKNVKIPSSSVRFYALLSGLFVLISSLIYLLFANGGIDEWATGLFYDPGSQGGVWIYEGSWWVEIAYKGASILTGLTGVVVIGGFIASFRLSAVRRFRSLFVVVFLTMLIGPGVFVNAILKDNWGRPRPRDTVTFGGDQLYVAPYVVSPGRGKSFPCGHCSVGFAMVSVGLWFGRGGKRGLSRGLMLGALLLGFYLGLARVAVGAHYFSDVLVSFLVVGLVAACVDRAIGLDEHSPVKATGPRLPGWLMLSLGGTGMAVLVAAGLLAYPHHSTRVVPVILPEGFQRDSVAVQLVSPDPRIRIGNRQLTISESNTSFLSMEARGFGFPGGNVSLEQTAVWDKDAELLRVSIQPKISGFFTELSLTVELHDGEQNGDPTMPESGHF
jgi:lipid A 4'-phosphatase